jgi:predicted DNA-binding mobile mystery protein A
MILRQQSPQIARLHLDSRIKPFLAFRSTSPPRRGWIRAIRDALGMTGTQLATRMRVTQPTVAEFERSEIEGRITLGTLERAAQALGCKLVYALVPEDSLENTVAARAREVAKKRLANVIQTMRLEDQELNDAAESTQLEWLTQHLLTREPRTLWHEE